MDENVWKKFEVEMKFHRTLTAANLGKLLSAWESQPLGDETSSYKLKFEMTDGTYLTSKPHKGKWSGISKAATTAK
ncbi:hypothetical protein SLS58_007345 [Diplodia intermedia]|uniref:Uncharacterized protein n=1 Tax=Diplodia intermedia TaxID=856260 RepID=A0ABR3TKI8_9PEZI